MVVYISCIFRFQAMVALNSRKMKYSTLRGSFSESGINEFLRELAVGRGRTEPVKDAVLPKVIPITPWDGKDGEVCIGPAVYFLVYGPLIFHQSDLPL